MTHKTNGIVLRSVKYGETSLVVTIFTELFGIQSYLVNGVRSSGKAGSKASLFQAGSILALVVYHNEQKQLQRIREFQWHYLYRDLMQNVVKNSIALYMVELLTKCLKQPEQHTDLYHFCEDALQQLDVAEASIAANFALYFTLHLPHFLGFRIQDDYTEAAPYLDFMEGCFVEEPPLHPQFLSGESAAQTSLLLKVMQPAELATIPFNRLSRRHLLLQYNQYYRIHLPDFGTLKTLPILQEILA